MDPGRYHRDMQYRIGKILIWVGVLAWVPYAALKYGARVPVPLAPFLTAHLLGVIPGAVLAHLGRRARRKEAEAAASPEPDPRT